MSLFVVYIVLQPSDMPLGARTVSNQFCHQLMSFSTWKDLSSNSTSIQVSRKHKFRAALRPITHYSWRAVTK